MSDRPGTRTRVGSALKPGIPTSYHQYSQKKSQKDWLSYPGETVNQAWSCFLNFIINRSRHFLQMCLKSLIIAGKNADESSVRI